MRKKLLRLYVWMAPAFLLIYGSASSQDAWLQKEDYGGASRKGSVSCSVGTKAYTGTGFDGVYRTDFWEWDQATDTWTQLADMGGAGRAYAACFPAGGKVYITTGYNGGFLGDTWEYDPVSNLWASRSGFPGGNRQGTIAVLIGDKGFVGLGFDGAFKNDFYEYDHLTDTWIPRASFSGSSRIYATAFAVASKAYVGTGYNGVYLNDFYSYDRPTDTWTALNSLPAAARGGAVSFAVSGKGYVGLGDDGSSLRRDFWEFDPQSGLWSQKSSLPGVAREHATAFSIGSKGYILCGSDNGVGYYKDFWEWQDDICTLSITALKENVSCYGGSDGSISLTATGAAGIPVFSWNSGDNTSSLTGLGPGTYGVTVRDTNNCKVRQFFTIGQPPAMVFGRDTTQWQMARRGGGTGNEAGRCITSDAAGNLYIGGTFTGSATFGSITLTSLGGSDVYLAKYNNLGNLQWIEQIGGTLDDEIGGIGIDSSGNVYAAGSFRVLAFFEGQQYNASGEADMFLARYSGSGNLIWVQTGGGFFEDKALALHTNRSGECFVTGYFQGISGFQGNTLVSIGGEDAFIASYNNAGVLEWIRQGGGISPDRGTAITQSITGDIAVSGIFQGNAVFGTQSVISSGDNDIFLARYSRYGNLLSVISAGGSGDDQPSALIADELDQLYLSGYFNGNAVFGGSPLASAGLRDAFVVKFNPSGTALFATRAGGSGDDRAHGIVQNALGHCFVSGSFSGSASFGTNNLMSAGSSDIFLARLDPSGAFAMAVRTGGTGTDAALAITLDPGQNPVFTGSFRNNFLISGTTLTSAGGDDMIFARLRESTYAKAPVITPVTCEGGNDGAIQIWLAGGTPGYGFAWSNGATTQNISNIGTGTYLLTVTDSENCTKDTTFVVTSTYVLPQPPISASVDRQNFCADDPGNITLTAVGGSGEDLSWYTASCGGTFVGTGTSIVIPSPEDTTTYYARWENPCGTTLCVEVSVNVIPLPEPPQSVSASQTTLCAGTGSLTLTATGGSGEVFRWYTGTCGGTLIATGNPVTIVPPVTNTTYYGRWESTCGQSACLPIDITVLPLAQPVATVTADPSTICYNHVGSISLTATGGSGNTLNWSLSCHGPVINQGPSVLVNPPTDTTTYYVWWENSCGPSACDSVTVNVLPQPVAPVAVSVSEPAYCIGSVLNIILTATGGSGDYVKWFEGYCGSLTVVGTGNPLVIAAPSSNKVYYARWETSCGFSPCSPGVSVTVNPLPVASFTGLGASYCEDALPVTLTGNYNPLGTFAGPGITDLGNGTATFDPAAAGPGGPYTITYSYTDANGCFDDFSATVVVRALPYVNFAGLAASYCLNASPVPLTGNQAPFGSFSGTGITASTNGVGTFSPAAAGVGGPYDITYSYTDIYGCSNSNTQTTSVTALPAVSFAGLGASYCINDPPATLTGNFAPEGFFSGAGIVNIGFGQAVFDPALAGEGGPYPITYTYTDLSGCTNSSTLTTSVTGLPVLGFTGLLGSYCSNSPASTLFGNMAPGGSFSGPGITSNPNGTASFDPAVAGPGNHIITYTFTNTAGCTNTTSQNTTVLPAPSVNFTGLNPNYCPNSPNALLTGNFAPFGIFTGTGVTDNNNGTATFRPSIAGVGGPYSITYTYQALNGCTNSITQQTTVNALPSVNFTGLALSYCRNADPATLTGNQAPQGAFGGPGITDNGNGTAAFNPSVAGVGTHSVYYFFTDGNACTDTMFKTVTVFDLPQPAIVDILPEYCENAEPDTITGSFYPLGSFTGPGIVDLGIGKAVFYPATAGTGGPYDIVYTYTDFNGCTEDTTYQVDVLAKPVVDFNPFAATYCIDDDPALLVGNHPPYGSFTGPGISDQGDGTAEFDPAAAGAGWKDVTYTFTDSNGCTNDTTKTTQVIPLPVKPAAVTISNNNFCTGSLTQIFLGVAGGSGDTVEVFQGSCGGTLLGQFEPPTLFPITAPTDTTVFYARWINSCGESECDSIQVNVIQMTMPPVPEVDTNNFCAGTVNIITLTATGGVGGYNSTLKWWKNSCGGTLVGIGQPLIITAPVDTTTYWVTYENACGVSDCDSIQVNVTPQPVAPVSLTVDTNFYCIGSVTQITLEALGGLGDTLYWFQDECGGTPIGFGTPLTITAPDTTTTYFAHWVNKCNDSECISITVEVVQLPEPPVALDVDENDFCAGVVGIIQLSATGGSGNTLQWFKDSCGGTLIGTGTPILTNAPVDTTTYYARWINQCAESECDSIIINVRPQPRPLDSLQVDPGVFCEDYAGIITLTAFGIFETGDTIRWYEGNCGQNFIGTGSPLSIPAPDTTTTYFAANSNSCGESVCVSVQALVNTPLPPTFLTADTTFICYDYADSLTLSAFGGHGNTLVWLADSCAGTPVATGVVAKIPPPDTTTVYFARWENECGESDCLPITIHVIEMPLPPDTFAVDTNYYCAGTVDFITLTAMGGYGDTISSLGETVRWFRKSCGSTSLGTGLSLTIPAPVVTTWYFARWENHCGVSECDSFEVVVHTARIPDSVTADTNNYCPGDVTALTLEAWGGYGDQLVWRRVLDGDTIIAGSGTPLNIAAPQVTTKYLARWETYCGPSPWREITIKVNIPEAPLALTALNDTLCSDDPGPVSLWPAGGNGDTLRWFEGSCAGTELFVGDTLIIPTPAQTTTYFARWENVCGVSECSEITIAIVPAPIVMAGSRDSVCEGSMYTIEGAVAENYSSLTWTTAGPGTFSDPSSLNPVYDPGVDIDAPLDVYLKLTVTGNSPCGVYSDSIRITINPKPVLSLEPPMPSLCRDSVIRLTAYGANDYKWLPNFALDTARGAVVHTFPPEDQAYSMVGISRSGCLDTLDFEVTVKPTPFVDLGEDQYLFSCEPVVLDAGGGDGSESYEWQDGSVKRTLTVAENGTYWVKVYNEGCAVMDTVEIELCNGYIHIPSAFTPNNDGLNDVFKVVTSDLTVTFHMDIFDRHGQLLFETDDPEQGWDGKVKGVPAPADIYVYKIRYRGKGTVSPGIEKIEAGTLVLVR